MFLFIMKFAQAASQELSEAEGSAAAVGRNQRRTLNVVNFCLLK